MIDTRWYAMGRRWGAWLLAGIVMLGVGSLGATAQEKSSRTALLLTIDGPIGPATTDYLKRGLSKAAHDGDTLLVIELDTPGGLMNSLHDIVKAILASPVPVVTYVSPSGARAASAGTYLLYASHIAAMAPATHLGSATPVQLGGIPGLSDDKGQENQGKSAKSTMDRKITEDAVAYIRSLAERRGRNADWAEDAVRHAANLNAQAALKRHVVDVVAPTLDDVFRQIDGRQVMMAQQIQVLRTSDLNVVRFDPDWRTDLLSVIANPNIAYFLLLAGFLGLAIELFNPGGTVPGVVGGICLLLALFAFQMLPVNYSGLGLLVLGLGFIVAEAFVPSFGVLGIGGIVAFVTGSILLMDGLHPQVSIPLIGGMALIAAGFLLWMVTRLLGFRRRAPTTGEPQMIGLSALVLEDFVQDTESRRWQGRVRVRGENWLAWGESAAKAGDVLDVTGVEGLHVFVSGIHQRTAGQSDNMPDGQGN